MARPLRRDHDHVVPLGRHDAAVVDVEAVREEQRRARLEVRQRPPPRTGRAARRRERGTRRAGRRGRRRRPSGRSGPPPRPRLPTRCRREGRPRPRRPESCRLSACACPWLPYPSTATLPFRRSTFPLLKISATLVPFRLGRRELRYDRPHSGGEARPGPCARARAHRRDEPVLRRLRPRRDARRTRT